LGHEFVQVQDLAVTLAYKREPLPPPKYTGETVPSQLIRDILELARWMVFDDSGFFPPTHGGWIETRDQIDQKSIDEMDRAIAEELFYYGLELQAGGQNLRGKASDDEE